MANAMASSSSSSGSISTLVAQSAERRKKIKADVDEAEDPLALYDNHLTWTLDKFPPAQLHVSGIVEFLEEGTRYLLGDSSYKGDLRYLKLWTTYAVLVDKPSTVFKFVLSHGIGTSLARLYEEYALALERENRHSAAEQVLEAGLKRKARPTARLSKALEAFRSRISTVPRSPPPAATVTLPRHKGTAETDALRMDPLKYHGASKASSSKPSAKAVSSSSTSATAASSSRSAAPAPASSSPSLSAFTSTSVEERYAVIRAPALPTKRPERLRADLTLLFPDGKMEYNIAEVRARSSRYKPREPSPPPPVLVQHPPLEQYSPAQSSPPDSPEMSREITTDLTRQIDFNDDGIKSSKRYLEKRMDRRSIGFSSEPTVTMNTKAALVDVFGMFNSPDKSIAFDNTPGGKHAPVRKIDVIPPPRFDLQPQTPSNPPLNKTPVSIKPYVDDENAGRKENVASIKFKPFVDTENPPRANAFTPGSTRKAFSVKETPAKTPVASSNTSKVFTPAGSFGVFRAQSTEAKTPAPTSLKPAFTPLSQTTPSFRVFSHPSENAGPTPARGGAFTPFIDENAGAAPTPSRTPLGERKPLRSAFAMTQEPLQEESEEEVEEVEYSLREDDEEEEEEEAEMYPVEEPQYVYADQQAEYVDEHDYSDEPPRHGHKTPLGGRFGKFDVMTPITERTYEYTGSHASASVHSSGASTGRFFGGPDAVSAAARLAAEVRAEADILPSRPGSNRMLVDAADEEEEGYGHEEDALGRRKPPPFRLSDGHTIDGPSLHEQHAGLTAYVEERTGTLSLADALDAANRVNTVPNPCNPFDPTIVASLLATIDTDVAHFDAPRQDAGRLDELQRFARKKARGSDGAERGVNVTLGERRFTVYDKLGEGGFGAVFAAKELKSRLIDDDEDEDDLDDDDDDEEEADMRFALKIVKPRNLWEFYILRKVHATLPPHLCASIIRPQALYTYRDESFLVLSLCTQGSLLDIVNKAPTAGIAQQGACLDELLVVFFTVELLRLFGGLHAAGIIHGDLKIDNCLLRLEDTGASLSGIYDPSGNNGWARKGVALIDFGRAIDTTRFPEEQSFIAEWATDARDCAEMRAGKPWTYHADYFGLAGIVFCMLFGRYIDAGAVATGPDGRARLVTPLKRYWQTALWTRLFDMLLNPTAVREDGELPIVDELAEVRGEFERWLVANCMRSTNTLKGLLKKIELSVL
ncbi:hypothetical protein PENSPDRAFT_750786 [Peniophora sp. CONT]|nr:hypothetical protein PENSPDRAFT_750786 [Peniophora sp. CONT]